MTQRMREQEQMETDESELPLVITQADTITSSRTAPIQRCIQMSRLLLKCDLCTQQEAVFLPFYSLKVASPQWWAKRRSLHINHWEGKQVWTPFYKFSFIFLMVPSVTFPVYNSMFYSECLSERLFKWRQAFHPTRVWMLRTAIITFAFRCGTMTHT